MSVEELLKTHPRPAAHDLALLARCIEECGGCLASCTICSDASLAEDDLSDMVRCIRLCLDCADVCNTTLRVMARQTDADAAAQRQALEVCIAACQASAEECDRHAQHHEHCRLCAEQCRRCESACQDLLL